MKLTAILIAILFGHSAAAYTVDGIKVFNGDRGGVVTVHKHVNGQRGEFRESEGRLTVSDVHVSLPVSDAESTASRRLSGKARFQGEHQFQQGSRLQLNGIFRTLSLEPDVLKLENIEVITESGGVEVSGTVFINDREFEIQDAPESIQNFVRRLIWWITGL